MKMKKWMGACAIASMVLTQSPVSVLANEFEAVDQTNLEMINEADGQKVFIGEKGYDSLTSAINEATNDQTIIVKGDNTENITISENKKITLEFEKGASLKNKDKNHTITVKNGATLKITGEGTITNNAHAKAALFNNNGGTVTLDGGITIDRPGDIYYGKNDSRNNTYYTVLNQGEMTIKNASIFNNGNYSSCLENGWRNSKDIPSEKKAVAMLTINDGANISGCLNSIENDENGELKITGGTITSTNQYAIMNWNKAEITGGVIESNSNAEVKAAIRNANSEATSKGELTISGTAVVKGSVAVINENKSKDTNSKPSLTISGGTLQGSTNAIVAKANTKTTISGGEIKGSLNVQGSPEVTVNGGSFTEKLPEGIQPGTNVHVHKIQQVSKDPTCTEPGVAEHYECTECHKTFADEKGQNDATPTVIPATGHTYTWVIDKEPTKDHAGAKYQYCVVCHHKTDPVSIPAIGYTEKVENAVYRAYNPNNGEHLYTANYDEFRSITSIGWQDEGIAFMTESVKEGNPLYRVYNPNSGLHHYTIDENEKNVLVSLGWRDEDVTMYTSKKPQCAAVFRVYNPNGGQHHYTKDANERNVLVSLGWQDEGIAFRTAEIPTK